MRRVALVGCLALAVVGCQRKHVSVGSVPELGYPTCGGRALAQGVTIASGFLRSGPNMPTTDVTERFEVRRRDCVTVVRARQEWSQGTADVDVVYDASGLPLRAWRRTLPPGVPTARGHEDLRRYELRTPEVTIKRRAPDGHVEREILRGPRPDAVITPGRGTLTPWLQHAHLRVGQTVREPVLDIREDIESIRVVPLHRDRDRFDTLLGRTVRVYTLFGRDTVFADEHDVVVGDLMGLRPDAALTTPAPPPMPLLGPVDPESGDGL